MPCLISSTLPLDCLDQIGGISQVWVSTNFNYTSFVAGVTGISSLTGGTGAFYGFGVAKDTASFTETFTISNTNGTAFFDQAITIPIQRLSQARRNTLLLLAYARNSRVVFRDNNNKLWIVGLTRGCVVQSGTTTTGTAPGDATQYSIVLQGQEPEMIFELTSLASLSGCQFFNA